MREPKLLLADEPFGALDALTRIQMHALLRQVSQVHEPAILLVTHDIDEAILLADRVVILDEGKLAIDLAVNLPQQGIERLERIAELRTLLHRLLGVYDHPSAGVPPSRDNHAPAHSKELSDILKSGEYHA